MLVLYLSNKYIRAVSGIGNKKHIVVQKMYTTEDTHGCILNGSVTDEDAFLNLMARFFSENGLSKKKIHLVVESNQFHSTTTEVPVQKTDKMLEFVSREFSDVERMTDPVYGFFNLPEPKKNKKMQKVFAMAAPREMLQQYKDLFKQIGIEVEEILPMRAAMLCLMNSLSFLQKETAVFQFLDDITIVNELIVEGKIIYTSKNRLYSEPGTTAYPVEAARAVNNILQFAKTQNVEQPILHVFVDGISKEDFQIYEESIGQINPELQVLPFDLSQDVVFQSGQAELSVPGMPVAIGALREKASKTGLCSQLKRNFEKEAALKERRKKIVPLEALGIVMLTIAVVKVLNFMTLQMSLWDVKENNTNPTIIAACDRYDELFQENRMLELQAYSMTDLKDRIECYPMANSYVDQVVQKCAVGLVEARVLDYNAETGIVKFETAAPDVEKIHQFVNMLSEQDLFAEVNYTGYGQDNALIWHVNVECTMAEREIEPETEAWTEEMTEQDAESMGEEENNDTEIN